MKVAITGLRPHKLVPENPSDFMHPIRTWVRKHLAYQLHALKPEVVYTGMTQGVDQDAAFVCRYLKIPYIAAVPFTGQESKWDEDSINVYGMLLKSAKEVVTVSKGSPAKYKYLKRNCWMVDQLGPKDYLIAVWDGQPGGTAHCLAYARKNKKQVILIDTRNFEVM